MMSRYRLALAGALLLLPQIAVAEEPVETALREKVAAIDALPDWSASYGWLNYDPSTDTATLIDFVARTETLGTEISIAKLTVDGYSASPDGSFTVKSVLADGGVVKLGFATIEIGDLGIENLFVPLMDEVAFVPSKPLTSMVKLYGEALKARFDRARVGSVAVVETLDGVETRITYDHLRLDGFGDGKLASMRAGPIRMESPSPQGLVNTTIGSIEGSDMDLAAFVRVYDPDLYAGGVGDMVWHQGIGVASYNDVEMDMTGIRLLIDSVVVEDTRVRQPPVPFGFFLDSVMVAPDMPDALAQQLALRHLPGLLGSWSFGRIGVNGFTIDATGIDRFSFDHFSLTDASVDGLGEIAIEGLEAAIRGQFAMRLGRFAIGDMPFGGIDGLTRLVETIGRGQDPDPESFAPKVGSVELAGLEVQTPDIDRMSLDRFSVVSSDYVGYIPSRTRAELAGLKMPTSAVEDRQARQLLERFGYEELDFNLFADTEWDPNSDVLTVKDLSFGLKQVGNVALHFALGGLPIAAFSDEKALEQALPNLTLLNGEVTFTDETIVGNALVLAGEQLGMSVPLEMFRKQFAGAIPFLMSIATASDPALAALVRQSGLMKDLTPAVVELVAAPGGSITFTVDPPSPVKVMSIPDVVSKTPEKLVDLLGLTITGKAGEPPAPPPGPEPANPAPAPAPGVEETPAPESPPPGASEPPAATQQPPN